MCAMLVPFIMNGQNTVRPYSIQETEPVDSVGYRGPSKTAEEDTGTGFFKGVIPCSPQAAALARYAEFPVSHTTGIPEISVPLYEIDLGGYRLPISISYHASGARPDEMPTSVGSGWSLNAGGAITRTILGKPDLYNNFNDSYDFKYYNYDNIRDLIYDVNHPGGSPDLMDLYYMVGDYTYPDTESDRYTYNIPGENGVFRYSYEDSSFVVLNNSNRIVRSYGNSSSSHVSFSILDNTGYEYVFGQEESTGVPSVYAEHPLATAWYATQIITPYGNIDFTYENAMSVDIQTIDVYADAALRPEYEERYRSDGEIELITVHRYQVGSHEEVNTCHYGQSILKKIEWNGNRIEFSYVDEHPGKTMQRLIGMKVYNSDGELSKSIGFDNTDNWPTEDNLTGRRMLKSVSDSEAGVWKFEYDKSCSLPELPLRDARATCCDLWGYWNTSVPDRYQTVFSKDQWKWLVAGDDHTGEGRDHSNILDNVTSRNRKPSLPHTKAGVLTKIVYPTGGDICYEYELNEFKRGETVIRTYGGLRVKSTTLHSGENAPAQVTTFSYNAPQTTVEEPEYLMTYLSYEQINEERHLGINWPQTVRNAVPFPINPVTACSSPLVYGHVIETRADGSSVSYSYDTYDMRRVCGIRDDYSHPSLYEQSRKDYGLGIPLLTAKTISDPNGKCVYEETYTYRDELPRVFSAGVRTFCQYIEYEFPINPYNPVHITPNYVALFGVLKYEESYAYTRAVVPESKTVSFPQTGFSTITAYTYDDGFRTFDPRSVTVTGSDGVSHRTEYSYPFDFPDDPVCADMVTNYLTDLPVETRTYSGTDLISKEKTEYAPFNDLYYPVARSSWSMPTSSTAADRTVPETLPERERVSAYNGKGRPLSITSNLTDVTSFKWDSTGTLLLAATAPGGLTTAYTHRPLFGLSSETLPNGYTKRYEYNGTGMLVKESDNGGPVSEYSYSVLNHFNPSLRGDGNSVTTMLWLDGAGSKKTVSRQYYNGTGAPTTLARGGLNTSGKYVYTSVKYDNLGRKSHETLPGAGGSSPADKTYAEVTALSQQTNGDDYVSSEITYDAAGRPLSVSTPGKAWHEASK